MSAFSLAGYYTLAMILDCDLLRRYAETHSEDAFAELVRRHINLVYSAAMRQVNGDSHLAQDVAQTDLSSSVFSVSSCSTLHPSQFHFYPSEKCLKFHFFALSCSF